MKHFKNGKLLIKFFLLTLDNNSNNDVATISLTHCLHSPLGIDFRIRYCAQILNLIVQDGLPTIFYSISKIRNIIPNINSYQARHELYFKCCKHLQKTKNKNQKKKKKKKY